jgi:hypothetical protein
MTIDLIVTERDELDLRISQANKELSKCANNSEHTLLVEQLSSMNRYYAILEARISIIYCN